VLNRFDANQRREGVSIRRRQVVRSRDGSVVASISGMYDTNTPDLSSGRCAPVGIGRRRPPWGLCQNGPAPTASEGPTRKSACDVRLFVTTQMPADCGRQRTARRAADVERGTDV
jgi:hypothetical protein